MEGIIWARMPLLSRRISGGRHGFWTSDTAFKVPWRDSNDTLGDDPMSALGQADICGANRHVRFTPKSVMCGAARDVRFGAIADTKCVTRSRHPSHTT